jgi:hypothetical protein
MSLLITVKSVVNYTPYLAIVGIRLFLEDVRIKSCILVLETFSDNLGSQQITIMYDGMTKFKILNVRFNS